MSRIRKIMLLIAVTISVGLQVPAQDITTDLAMINQNYGTRSLSIDLKYRAFPNHTATVPVQEEIGQIKKKGELVYYRVGPMESISASDYNLVVNHDDKMIFLLPKSNLKEGVHFSYVPEDVNKLLTSCEQVEFSKLASDQGSYDLMCSISSYSRIKVAFNTKTFFLDKIELFYRNALPQQEVDRVASNAEPARLEIIHQNIKTDPEFASNTFTYEKFLVRGEGDVGYRVKEPYRGYQFFSQMSQ